MNSSAPARASSHQLPLVDEDGLRAGVDKRLEQVIAEQADTLFALSSDSSSLIDAWQTLVSGGKRLRAAFSYWGYRAIAGESLNLETKKALHRVGAALELFQAAALFHDDVMDRSDTRRGNPTAHKSFEAAHNSLHLVGDAEQYGISTAILLGDLSLVASESEFRNASYAFEQHSREKAHNIFDLMRTTVTVGQFLDIHAQVQLWEQDLSRAIERAYHVIRTKTSSYSVTHPILIGAALAGASQSQLEALERFAMPIGIAYQLHDDLLGAFGETSATGKPIGDDLREGKRTVLVLEALTRLTGDERNHLQDSLGQTDLSDDEVAVLLDYIKRSGAVAVTEAKIEELYTQALTSLEGTDLEREGISMLTRLAEFSLSRSY